MLDALSRVATSLKPADLHGPSVARTRRSNYKRLQDYRELELNLCIKPRHRLVREKPLPLALPTAINQSWSMDFMHDQLADGRGLRLFNVVDEFSRAG